MKPNHLLSTSLLCIAFFSCSQKSDLSTTTQGYFELVRPSFKGDVAFETTAFVEQYWRVAGNTGFNASVELIAKKLDEAGFTLEDEASADNPLTYRIETRPMDQPTWEPGEASLTIVGESEPLLKSATNRNMVYLNSSSTAEGGITGEVIYIENQQALKKANLTDKIVFAEFSPYRLYKAAIDGGAIGMITYDNPAYLQPEKNTTSIQFRSIPYNEEAKMWGVALSYEAKEKLKDALANGTVNVKADITTKSYPSEELTVVANVLGSELPKESLVFSAHIQEPGANDNATGVGTQLEMAMITAKLISEKKLEVKRTLTFLWGDEIVSTRRYIQEEDKRSAEINWGISLDMVGENTEVTGGSFLIEKMPDPSAIWTRGNDKHSEWGGDVMTQDQMTPHYFNDFIINVFETQGKFANWKVNTNPFEGGSDHTPFLRADIPGLLLWHFTDQFYHTDNDRIDKVSQTTMTNVGIGALTSAYTLINADEKTAAHMVDAIVIAAKDRLSTEFELSTAAIAEGKSIEEESKILTTWTKWYQEALATTTDMAPNSTTLSGKIDEAKVQLDEIMEEILSKIQ